MRELPMPEECLGYGLVVPFPAYGFAALVPHNESLNSLNSRRHRSLKKKRVGATEDGSPSVAPTSVCENVRLRRVQGSCHPPPPRPTCLDPRTNEQIEGTDRPMS